MSANKKGSTANRFISGISIENKIQYIRGKSVIFDSDLAELYEVETKKLVQAVKRNNDRFPEDFMFRVNQQEYANLRSQFVTSSWGGRRYLPYVFTEQCVAMLSSVLNSRRAIAVNIQIMRIFVKLREMSLTYEELRQKILAIEAKYDKQFKVVFVAIKKLLESSTRPKKGKIGFH